MRRYFLLLPVFLFLAFTNSFAQEKAEKPFKVFTFRWITEKPTIEVAYGLSDINLDGKNTNFNKPGMIELRLGYASEYTSKYSKKVINYDNDYLFVSNATTDLYSQRNNAGVNSSMWRFGFGNKEGMGLQFGNFSMMPYNANSFVWSRFAYDENTVAGNSEYDKFADFNETFRFGTSTEAGINLQLTKGISIQPKYEVSDIFPRHLFGQQFVSSIIELGGAHMIDEFVTKVMRHTPVAGTIVNFVLKNAYEYGIYQLRKDHMNWPFTGEAPLRYTTFKMGMTFTF